jgi:hypothetical protein
MPFSHSTPAPCQWFCYLAAALDRRSAARLALVFVGAVLARGRRTVTSWIRAAGLSADYKPVYTTAAAAGKRADSIAARLAIGVLKPLVATAERLTFALDDTPTPRYGPQVQGAGTHHNPAPGPAGGPFVYGHVWVVLAALVTHPEWGSVALPLLARLYVRAKSLAGIAPRHRPAFRTKLELAVELLRWAKSWMGGWKKPLWVVADGAYAKAAFLKPMKALGVTVVSRLRKDAALWTEPGERRPGQRGRRRVYGEHRIDLAKRAGQRRGWSTGTFDLYGEPTVKRYKTFCSDPTASVADVLELIAARFTLETAFRDLKEVVGAGQQQTRFVWASVGSFHVCCWTFTMTEAWAWGRPCEALADRSASPWDDPRRRPSHADKRRAWRRELLRQEIHATLLARPSIEEIQATAERLLALAY